MGLKLAFLWALAVFGEPVTVADLVRYVPDSTQAVMLLRIEKSTLMPFDKLAAPISDVLPFDVQVLVGSIRPLSMGAVEMSAGKDNLGPLALVRIEEDLTQTIVLSAPRGTAERAGKATETLSGLRFAPAKIGWGTLLLDDRMFALVSGRDAEGVARLLRSGRVGHPRALAQPLAPLAPELIAQVRGAPPRAGPYARPDLRDVAVDIRDDGKAMSMHLTLRCVRGRGRGLAAALRALGARTEGPVGEVYRTGSVTEPGRDVVRASYSIPPRLASAILFGH